MFSDIYFVSLTCGVMNWSLICVVRQFLGVPWNVQLSVFCDISLGCHGLLCDLYFVTFPRGVMECPVIFVL